MGNAVFRYFLEWLRVQMREEAYERYVERAKKRAASRDAGGMEASAPGDATPMGGSVFWRGRTFVDDWFRYYLPGGVEEDKEEDKDGEQSNFLDGDLLKDLSSILELDEDGVDSITSDRAEELQGSKHQGTVQDEEFEDNSGDRSRDYPKLWEL